MSVRRITLSQVGAETEDITKQQTLRLTLISLSMLSMCAVGRGFVKLVDISSVVPKKKNNLRKIVQHIFCRRGGEFLWP